ncbi:MAG: hypothetical protein ACYTFX_05705 [Planctomycetota bacterium]
MANTADDTFHLYGVADGSALEGFGETTLTHASSAVFVDQYLDTDTYPLGIDTSAASGYFYDSDSDGADVLASFSVSSTAAAGDAFNISTAEMLAFAQASADSLLTLQWQDPVCVEREPYLCRSYAHHSGTGDAGSAGTGRTAFTQTLNGNLLFL